MKVYGNIRELVAAFFRRNGFEIGITPHANTYLANTTFTLPPKTSGAGILVSEDGIQDLSNKNLLSPTMVTPALGTPSSGNLSNTTAFPTANLSGLGANMATFLATPTSANLAATLTDETGTGPNVFGTSPTITGPLFTSDTVFSNIATPANPSAGTIKIYSKAGVPTYLSSAGVERVIANTTDSLANPMTAVGDLIYGGTSGVATRLAPNITTVRQVLTETGTGAAGLAPVWSDDLASATENGRVSTGTQTFAGVKTFTGQVNIQDGSVTEPAIGFSSDDDTSGTGFYRVSANSMGLASNGVNTWTVNNAGAHTWGQTGGGTTVHTLQSGGISNLLVKSGGNTPSYITYFKNTANRHETGVDDSGPGGTNGYYFYSYSIPGYTGGISTAGAFTLGPSGAGSLSHTVNGAATFQSSQTGASAVWKFNNTGAAPASARVEMSALGTTAATSVYHRFLRGAAGTTVDWDVGVVGATNGSYVWAAAGSTTMGSVLQDGTWTLGPTGAAEISHLVQNSATGATSFPLVVRNNNTTTGSDGLPSLIVQKGSTTNGVGANELMRFRINAGGTGSGSINSNGANNAAFFAASDVRKKKDIENLSGALDKVLALRPVTYKWKEDSSDAVGFLAQEFAQVLPKFVLKTDDGLGEEVPEGSEPWQMTESGMVPYLVKAIQEQQVLIATLTNRLEALENA